MWLFAIVPGAVDTLAESGDTFSAFKTGFNQALVLVTITHRRRGRPDMRSLRICHCHRPMSGSLDGSTANRDGDGRQRPVIPVEVLRPAGREVVEQPSAAHLRIDCILRIASLIPASSEGTSPACSVD